MQQLKDWNETHILSHNRTDYDTDGWCNFFQVVDQRQLKYMCTVSQNTSITLLLKISVKNQRILIIFATQNPD